MSQEKRQFGTALGWRLLIYLTAPPMMAGLGYTALRFWHRAATDPQPTLTRGLAVLMLGFAVFLLYALLEVVRWRLILTPTHFISAGLLRTRKLSFANIRGFRVDENYLHILPRSEGQPTIKVGYATAGYDALKRLLAERFPEFDAADDAETLLADPQPGLTEQLRAAQLQAARTVATVLNIAGGAVTAWLVLRPLPCTSWP